jgi:hypothetical protein
MKAIETLEDLIDQSRTISSEIESFSAILVEEQGGESDAKSHDHGLGHSDSPQATRLVYLVSHLEALRATLSVLLQTLFTAQSIIWSKYVPLRCLVFPMSQCSDSSTLIIGSFIAAICSEDVIIEF